MALHVWAKLVSFSVVVCASVCGSVNRQYDDQIILQPKRDALVSTSNREATVMPSTVATRSAPDPPSTSLRHSGMGELQNNLFNKSSFGCAFDKKKGRHQWSISVELQPRIAKLCLDDICLYCSDHAHRGQKLYCLQEHFDRLKRGCREAVDKLTEDINKDPRVDKIIMKTCALMIDKVCKDKRQPGDLMECLIRNKHDEMINPQCTASIEHLQLIAMKDLRFSYKFKEACAHDIQWSCKQTWNISITYESVRCLSETIRDYTLNDMGGTSQGCREQLRFELLQQGEDIKFNPPLQQACQRDVGQFCPNVMPSKGKVLECLKRYQQQLSFQCRKKVFQREEIEAVEQHADFLLMKECGKMIKLHCADQDPYRLVHCLRQNSDGKHFDAKCRDIMLSRQEMQALDIRLNPVLYKACKGDSIRYCKALVSQQSGDKESGGKVISCLKGKLKDGKLSLVCADVVREVVRDAFLNYKQNPMLVVACEREVETLCIDSVTAVSDRSSERGLVVECLMKRVQLGDITRQECIHEIARVVVLAKSDIVLDPPLHSSCALDLEQYCELVPIGEGSLSCMLSTFDDRNVVLRHPCRSRLEDRIALWKYLAEVTSRDIQSIANMAPYSGSKCGLEINCAIVGVLLLGAPLIYQAA